MKLPCLVTITLFALSTPSLFAQDHVLTLGFADSQGPMGPNGNSFPLARGKDADRDGVVDNTEIHTFMTKTFGSRAFNTDIRSVVEEGEFTFFVSDSDNGVIMRARDDNHNGVLDDPEVTLFFDFGPSSSSGFSPDGLAAYRDTTLNETRVYVAKETDNTNTAGTTFGRGIWRLVDGNGNGNAMDPGEAAPFVTSAMNLQVNDGMGNPVTINAGFFEWIRVTANGKVVVWRDGLAITNTAPTGQPPVFPPSQDAFVFYGFTDNAGTAVPEVFANFSSLNTFTQFPDFANGTFPNWDISSVGTTGLEAECYARFFDGTPGGGPNGENLYYFGSSYATNRSGDVNLNGQPVAGIVYRWLDANNNDTLEMGELDMFGNISTQPYATRTGVTVPSVSYVDRGAGGATVSSLDFSVYSFTGNDGSAQTWHDLNDCVLTMRDANGNGIIDQGELIQTYYTPQPYTTPFSPAFGPFLENIFAFAVGEMPGPFPTGVEPYGEGCEAPSRGLIPVMDSWNGSPAVGNAAFEVGAIRSVPGIPGIGGPPVFLVASFGQDLTGVSLAPFGLTGCFGWTVMPTTLGLQFTDEHGRAIFATPIPNNGLLTGLALYFQCAIVDPGTTPPRSTFYTTNALKVTIQ